MGSEYTQLRVIVCTSCVYTMFLCQSESIPPRNMLLQQGSGHMGRWALAQVGA